MKSLNYLNNFRWFCSYLYWKTLFSVLVLILAIKHLNKGNMNAYQILSEIKEKITRIIFWTSAILCFVALQSQ